MWTSPDGNSNNNASRLTCSPSNSKTKTKTKSRSNSKTIPTSPPFPASSNSRKSMEEVWKDITLASLHDHHSKSKFKSTSTSTSTTLQDFLATPFHKDPPASSSGAADITFLGSLPAQPAGILSSIDSGSGLDFRFLDSNTSAGPVKPSPQLQTTTPSLLVSYNNSALDTLGSSSVFPANSRKRPHENGNNSTDRRHKRMIKNRESAARSRARKQAYTNELELEVAHLQEENARLRRQQTKLSLAAPAQLPKKHTLLRTSTAPF